MLSDVFRQPWLDDILMQCFEPFGQLCTKFLPMPCCSKSIKTTLNKIFSYAMLSKPSRTTLHKVVPAQLCPRRYFWDNASQEKTLRSVVREIPNNIVQEKFLYHVALIPLEQHYTGENPM